MTKTTRPDPIRCRDKFNRPVVLVALDPSGKRWATVDEADFDALPPSLSLAWTLNRSGNGRPSYVKAPFWTAPGHLVNVARVILRAGSGRWVRYGSADKTDLTRLNIWAARGGKATREDRALVAAKAVLA